MLVLQVLHGLSLQQTSYLVGDRLSWRRFCGLRPGADIPDANTLWDFREALIAAQALDRLLRRLERAISAAGYLPMFGQIIDATLVAAPRQRQTEAAKAQVKAGKTAPDGAERPEIAIPTFGGKAHISIDRCRRPRRRASARGPHRPRQHGLRGLGGPAYRSQANEDFLSDIGKFSRIPVKRPVASRCRSEHRGPTPGSRRCGPASSIPSPC